VVDNTRTAAVLIAGGVKTSDQTEAGAVLRNLIPQAVAAEKTLTSKPILSDVAKAVTKTMAATHPQIRKNQTKIVNVVKAQSAKARKASTQNE
jgi:alanyl-tRNA synthetase